jgi:hypothetical protein
MKTQLQKDHANLNNALNFMKVIGAIALLLAPTLSFIGWAIAHDSISSFLSLNFTWEATDATTKLTAASDPALLFRYYLFPHYFIYASMLVYIGLALCLAYVSYKTSPWHSFIGLILSIIGAVYFVGVLGAFLSIPMGTVKVTAILKVSFALCILTFVGNIVQGFGLYQAKLVPRWSSILFILGNMLILIFPGTENWMAIGSLCMVISLVPLTRMLFQSGA